MTSFKLSSVLIEAFLIVFLVDSLRCQGASREPPQLIAANVSYGSHPQQIMDIYLPAGRNSTVTKVFVLIHGGGWTSGSKEAFNYAIPYFYYTFPTHAIVNLGYRLASVASPGFPKQVEDIQLALQFLTAKSVEFNFSASFALVGNSAGGHLSMLYGYGFDTKKQVKVICNTVGPVDFTHPSYSNNSAYTYALLPLVGNYTFAENPTIYAKASPVYYINKDSPKTISFYGNADPLIPKEQGEILEDKLDSVGVCNKYYLYNGGHGNWNQADAQHTIKKMTYFFKSYF